MDFAWTYIMIMQQTFTFFVNLELLWKFDRQLINGSIVIAHMFVVFLRSQNNFQNFTIPMGFNPITPETDIISICLKYLKYIYTDEMHLSHTDIIDFLNTIIDFRLRIFENICFNVMTFNAWFNVNHESCYQILDVAMDENWRICRKLIFHSCFTKIHFNFQIKPYSEILLSIVEDIWQIQDERHLIILEAIIKWATEKINWNLEIRFVSSASERDSKEIFKLNTDSQQICFDGEITVRIFKGTCKVLS